MNEESVIKVTYNETEITYDERANVWRFILRGINRHSDTLAKAKEAIDKPPPKKKSQFKRFDAFYWQSWGGPALVEVTSIADHLPGYRVEVHISYKDKDHRGFRQRSRVQADDIFPCDAIVNGYANDWRALEKEIETLKEKQSRIRAGMVPFKPVLEE